MREQAISFKLDPAQDEIDGILQGIIEHAGNAGVGDPRHQTFGAFVTDPETGKQLAGASGFAFFDWVFVQFLGVDVSLRGTGIGTALMHRVEQFAREHGCVGIWLDTFSFQARPFYEKLGFAVFGTIDDHPRGGRRYFMSKRLDGAGSSALENPDGA